jgi:hypothetical protein
MKLIKTTAFTALKQDPLAVYANNVITLMGDNTLFSNLNAEIAVLKQCYDDYAAALSQNVNGGRVATFEKDTCKKALILQLYTVAITVDVLANGQESIILLAGFDVRRPATKYTALNMPTILKVENEKTAGVATLYLVKVPGATNYSIEKRIKTAGSLTDAPWMNGDYSTAAKAKLTDLQSATYYEFRIRAIGNKGLVSEWSPVVGVWVS